MASVEVGRGDVGVGINIGTQDDKVGRVEGEPSFPSRSVARTRWPSSSVSKLQVVRPRKAREVTRTGRPTASSSASSRLRPSRSCACASLLASHRAIGLMSPFIRHVGGELGELGLAHQRKQLGRRMDPDGVAPRSRLRRGCGVVARD